MKSKLSATEKPSQMWVLDKQPEKLRDDMAKHLG